MMHQTTPRGSSARGADRHPHRSRRPEPGPASGAGVVETLSGDLLIRDWTQQNKTWFCRRRAGKTHDVHHPDADRGGGGLNLVSTLVMTVTAKRADIRDLRTLCASPNIMGVLWCRARWSAMIGTLSGCCGPAVAFNIDGRAGTGRLLNASFLQGWHTISRMPSRPQYSDIMPIVVISLIWPFWPAIYRAGAPAA
jgi:lipoprotein-releasing system permease protein